MSSLKKIRKLLRKSETDKAGSGSYGKSTSPLLAQPSDAGEAVGQLPHIREDFGLFSFSDSAASIPHDVDIVAVHGLGGHWEKTWQAVDDKAIWLRDRLPNALDSMEVKARVFSYGYDSATVFSSSVTDIDAAAEMLLGRLQGVRKTEDEKRAPLIFVCHSLGGLVAKEAMVLAWENHSRYGALLERIKGCIFLGVPHRGSDLAYWAELPANIIHYGSLGLAGNPRFLSSLKKNSPEWMQISKRFVHRGAQLKICTFFETDKLGNVIVVNQDSATMLLPNEVVLPLAGSNHRTICKFGKNDNQRYKPVADALEELVQDALNASNTQPMESMESVRNLERLCSELPIATSKFYGRETELQAIAEALDPRQPGQKGIVLFGIGGSGKTQLALRYIQQYQQRYTAVIWINASTEEHARQSFGIAEEIISSHWPRDGSVQAYAISSSRQKVTSQLQCTRYTQWLLVIDSVDDLIQNNPKQYIPNCGHGAVLVTSTQSRTGHVLGLSSMNVDDLDLHSSRQLLFKCADISMTSLSKSDSDTATAIVKHLNGLPLAIEQAGGLLQTSFSLSEFLIAYKEHYRLVMTNYPEGASYDKKRSIVAVFDMLYSTIKSRNPGAAAFLIFIAILGPWQIPMPLMKHFQNNITEYQSLANEDTKSLTRVLCDHSILRLALDTLNKICLVMLKRDDSGSCESFSLHRAICEWCLEKVASKPDWIIQATSGLAAGIICPTPSSHPAVWRIDRQRIMRSYLAPLDHCDTLIHKYITEKEITAPDGMFCASYAKISAQLAQAHLSGGRTEKALTHFNTAIEFEMMIQGDKWPSTEASLDLLEGLAVANQKSGDLQKAAALVLSAQQLSERLFGEKHWRSAAISLLYKNINERTEVMLRHHKSIVVAATDAKISGDMRHASHVQQNSRTLSSLEELDGADPAERIAEGPETEPDYAQELLGASYAGDHVIVRLLLGIEGVEADAMDSLGRTALTWAAKAGHEAVVKLLLASGKVSVDPRDSSGRTPLSIAAQGGHEAIVKLLLAMGKVDVDSKDDTGRTPLSIAAGIGHEAVVELLLATGKVNVDSNSDFNQTPLFWAAGNGHEAIVKLLLATGEVNVDSKDELGRTPLSRAASYGREAVVKLLLATGKVDVNSRDDSDLTPLGCAIRYGHEAVVRQLESFIESNS